jgi:hypothetical protein
LFSPIEFGQESIELIGLDLISHIPLLVVN